jgi:cytoskeletal protein CcmA (bactofilin family)
MLELSGYRKMLWTDRVARDREMGIAILSGGNEPALPAHDDRYDDAPEPIEHSPDTTDDAGWQQSEPGWRNRLADDREEQDALRGRGPSIISAGTSSTGTLRSEDPLYIEGSFEGEIIASGDVTIARGAHLNARIQAIRLTVAGSLEGSVACTDRIEIVESGVVDAKLLSPTFIVHEGATINGTLKMRIDDEDGETAEEELAEVAEE